MDILDRIRSRQPITKQIKADLSSTKVATILYGAASAAEAIYDFLDTNGIRVDAVAVDREYLPSSQETLFRGHGISAIEDVAEKYSDVNFFIGFAQDDFWSVVSKKIERLVNAGLNIHKTYALDWSLLRHPERAFDYADIKENVKQFDWLYNVVLCDQRSKDVLIACLNQRITMEICEIDKLRDEDQYFVQPLIKLSPNEAFIDCGAYDGDSVRSFLRALKRQGIDSYAGIMAFEPDSANYQKLSECCQHLENVVLFNKAAWSEEAILRFSGNRQTSSMIMETGENQVAATSIDAVLSGQRATFIKMDIQGAEREALRGAEETIREHSPKLAICAYHKKDDLYVLPKYLRSINPSYTFYLRAHRSVSSEVVLYGVPRQAG